MDKSELIEILNQRDMALAAANARVDELEYKLMAQTETALQEKAKREQAEAQCALLKQENSKLAMASIEQPPYKQDLIDRMKRMEDALEQIACDACNDCGNCQRDMEIAREVLEEKP